jgi:hypothetical protein
MMHDELKVAIGKKVVLRERSERSSFPPPSARKTMGVFGVIAEELGLTHIRDAHSRRDVALLLVSRFIRMAGSVLLAPPCTHQL